MGESVGKALAGALAFAALTSGCGRSTTEAPPARAQQGSPACDRVVARGGDDDAAGDAATPFATPRRLVRALEPGQTGCIRGEVSGNAEIDVDRVTLTSEPGQRGTLRGELIVGPGASGVTVADLDLDGSTVPWPTPAVLGDGATLRGNDITSRRRHICVLLGLRRRDARATRTLIVDNRIHDCGTSTNQEHGIYVAQADDTRIVGNLIYDNGDRAIQLYPDAQRTEVTGNVIDGNGQGIIFSGGSDTASSGTRVHGNVISNPRSRSAVESFWQGPVGTDNVVERNCLFGGRFPVVDARNGGFVARDNVVARPRFVDRDAGDLRLVPGSACARLLGR